MALSYDQYAAYMLDWCKIRGESFKLYFPLKGGWEAWVQADYAAYVLSKDSTVDILREVPIYNNGLQRVDWLFNQPDPAGQKIAIEIKCQSFDNRDAFIAGMGADIAKLNQANIHPAFKTCQTGVFGICFEQEAADWMAANHFVTLFNNGEVICGIRKLYP